MYMPDLNSIVLIVISLAQIFLQFCIITKLFKINVHWLVTLTSSSIISILHFESLFLMLGIFFGSTIVYYSLLARMRREQVVLAIALQLFLALFINNIFNIVLRVFTPIIDISYLSIVTIIVLTAILTIIKKTGFTAINLTRGKIVFTLSLTLMFIALGSAIINYFLFHDGMSRNVIILNAFGIFVIQATTIYVVSVLNKFTSEVENAELQKQYSKTLEKSLVEWEGFQHGFRNQVNTLNGFREAEDSKGLYAYIDRLENGLNNEKSVIEINRHIKDNMPCIYGITLAKTAFAVQNGIRFSVMVTAKKFELKTLNEVQLSRMVGNLLDNAMEHALLSTEKCVDMEISNHIREKIRIVISNSVDEQVDTSKIFQRGYSGKKGHTGFGLYEVQAIVDNRKEEGWYVDFSVSCTDNTFIADLLV